MDFQMSFATGPRFTTSFADMGPDPVEAIREALRVKLDELGCPECCSAMPLTFIKESDDFGGSGTIIGNGYTLERLTRLSDDWLLAEGANGGAINIGDIATGETVDVKDFFKKESRAALLIGSQKAMNDFKSVDGMLKSLHENPVWQERAGAFDAIGFAASPLVLRTNDPLIS